MARIASALALVLVSLASGPIARAQDAELPRGLYPVLHDEGLPPRIVLRARTDAGWARGPVRLVRRESPTVMVRRVALGALPAEVRADARGTLELSDGQGVVCTARIGRPRILRHVWAPWEHGRWNGEHGTPRLSDEAVAREAWDMDTEGELLVAPIVRVRGDCSRAEWASPSLPTFGGRSITTAPELVNAFRALPEHRELADAWLSARQYDDDPTASHWDMRAGAGLTVLELTVGSRRFSLIAARAHDGCGDFVGTLWALFEHRDDGITLVRSERWYDSARPTPSWLADFDHDGVPEVLAREIVTHARGVVDLTAPFIGCPC